jgi:hypothetical protein
MWVFFCSKFSSWFSWGAEIEFSSSSYGGPCCCSHWSSYSWWQRGWCQHAHGVVKVNVYLPKQCYKWDWGLTPYRCCINSKAGLVWTLWFVLWGMGVMADFVCIYVWVRGFRCWVFLHFSGKEFPFRLMTLAVPSSASLSRCCLCYLLSAYSARSSTNYAYSARSLVCWLPRSPTSLRVL